MFQCLGVGTDNVNTSEQDCIDVTQSNRFAVVCVDSYEDDSLDLEMVKDPDASCMFSGPQGGQSVGLHDKLDKKSSDFVEISTVRKLECHSVNHTKHMAKN